MCDEGEGEGELKDDPRDGWEQWKRGLAVITTYRRGFEDWFAYVLRLVTQPRNAAHAPCLDCLSDSVARFSINNTIYIHARARVCVRAPVHRLIHKRTNALEVNLHTRK